MPVELPEILDGWWGTHFSDLPTIPHMLRDWLSDRWVRFHSLPDSKRYATTDEEQGVLLARHHALIDEMFSSEELAFVYSGGRYPGATASGVVDSGEHWKSVDFGHGRTSEVPHDVELLCLRVRRSSIGELLRNVAENHWSECLIIQLDRPAFLHPYDGGIDVFAETLEARDKLKTKYAGWLSAHPKGL